MHVSTCTCAFSLARICSSVLAPHTDQSTRSEEGVAPGSCDLAAGDIEQVFGCYMHCLGDYTMDRRGDVGAAVREAAMTGISTLVPLLTSHDPASLSAET